MRLIERDVPPRARWALEQGGLHPLLAQLYAARGVTQPSELDDALTHLLPPTGLLGTGEAARLLADAMAAGKSICIVADYDCDGATACAVAVRGLRLLGARHVSYLVPDRVVDGYGLTAPIATFGQIEGQVQSAEAVYEQAKIRYLQSAQQALREVNDALSGIDKTRRAFAAQQKRVMALQESAYFARLRFDNGLTSYLEVLNAEDDLFSAQLAAVDAQSAGFGEMINAYKAMGGGWVDQVDPIKERVSNINSSSAGL